MNQQVETVAPSDIVEASEGAKAIANTVNTDELKTLILQADRDIIFNEGDLIAKQIESFVEKLDLKVVDEASRKKLSSASRKIGGLRKAYDDRAKDLIKALEAELQPLKDARVNSVDAIAVIYDQVKKPVIDYENKEAEAKREALARIEQLRSMGDHFDENGQELTQAQLEENKLAIEAVEITVEIYGDQFDQAEQAKEIALRSVVAGISAQENLARTRELERENEALRNQQEGGLKPAGEVLDQAVQGMGDKPADDQTIDNSDQKENDDRFYQSPEVQAETAALVSGNVEELEPAEVRKRAYEALESLGFELDMAKAFIGAVHKGMVPNVIIRY